MRTTSLCCVAALFIGTIAAIPLPIPVEKGALVPRSTELAGFFYARSKEAAEAARKLHDVVNTSVQILDNSLKTAHPNWQPSLKAIAETRRSDSKDLAARIVRHEEDVHRQQFEGTENKAKKLAKQYDEARHKLQETGIPQYHGNNLKH